MKHTKNKRDLLIRQIAFGLGMSHLGYKSAQVNLDFVKPYNKVIYTLGTHCQVSASGPKVLWLFPFFLVPWVSLLYVLFGAMCLLFQWSWSNTFSRGVFQTRPYYSVLKRIAGWTQMSKKSVQVMSFKMPKTVGTFKINDQNK